MDKNGKSETSTKDNANAIGNFHQEVLGRITDCEDLGSGVGLDVINKKKKIIAEVKNKYNTTKGNHKTEIYDAIETKLSEKAYQGYTGFYVEIIPQRKKEYNKPFTPSDNKISNKSQKRRPSNDQIRIIDGKSFYALLSGNEFALQKLFEVLPRVITENFRYNLNEKATRKYIDLFAKVFRVK